MFTLGLKALPYKAETITFTVNASTQSLVSLIN